MATLHWFCATALLAASLGACGKTSKTQPPAPSNAVASAETTTRSVLDAVAAPDPDATVVAETDGAAKVAEADAAKAPPSASDAQGDGAEVDSGVTDASTPDLKPDAAIAGHGGGDDAHDEHSAGGAPGVAPMRFPLKAFPPEDQDSARKASRRAARFVRKEKWGKAIGAYQKALTLDPNSWSRYELMTTYLKAQLRAPALGMLRALRQWSDSKYECFICKVWLTKSRSDRQFAALHNDPAYKSIVAGVKVEEPDYALMTKKFLAEVDAGLRDMLKTTLERQMTLRVLDKTRTVDAKTGEDSDWSERVFFFSSFEEVEKATLTKYDEPKRIRCRSRCCRLSYPKATLVPSAPPRSANVKGDKAKGANSKRGSEKAGPTEPCDFNRLDKICFWPFGKESVATVQIEQRLCEVKAMKGDDLLNRIGKDGWTVPPVEGAKKSVGEGEDTTVAPPTEKPKQDPNAERPPGRPTVTTPPPGL